MGFVFSVWLISSSRVSCGFPHVVANDRNSFQTLNVIFLGMCIQVFILSIVLQYAQKSRYHFNILISVALVMFLFSILYHSFLEMSLAYYILRLFEICYRGVSVLFCTLYTNLLSDMLFAGFFPFCTSTIDSNDCFLLLCGSLLFYISPFIYF